MAIIVDYAYDTHDIQFKTQNGSYKSVGLSVIYLCLEKCQRTYF